MKPTAEETLSQLLFYWNNPHYSDEQLCEYTADILNAYQQQGEI